MQNKTFKVISIFSNFLAYRINANAVQELTVQFANPIDIDVPVDGFYLLTDNDRINQTCDIDVSNFHLSILYFQQFYVPSHTKDFTHAIKFKTNKLGPFKIIGYILNSFNTYSKCLFVDLLNDSDELNTKHSIKKPSQISATIQASYDFDVLVEMPIVDDIVFAKKNPSDQFEMIQSSPNKELIFECNQGEK
jgi:hypothetical protein